MPMHRADDSRLHAIAEQAFVYDDGTRAMRALCGAVMPHRRPLNPTQHLHQLCPHCLAALEETT